MTVAQVPFSGTGHILGTVVDLILHHRDRRCNPSILGALTASPQEPEQGLAYATPPPLLELPHVLQLLDSIGVVDVTQDTPDIAGTDTMVALTYHPKQITDGVYVRASTDYHPPAVQKHKYPNWDYQKRTLNVYFDDDPSFPRLMIDFWIKFIRSGDIAIRPGQLQLYDSGSSQPRYLELHFVEDQLMNMNRTIYESFAEAFAQFGRDPRVLS